MIEDSIRRNSFLYRFTAVNIFGFALLGAACYQGWVSQIYQTDTTHITVIIAITFLFGLVNSLWKAVGLNLIWNELTDNPGRLSRWIARPDATALRLASSLQIVHHIAVILLLMGISGTMIGIIMALKSTEAFSTSDQASMVVAIVMLFKGVYIKFYASLVGIVGHMWILNNYSMLTGMGRRLLARFSEHA